MRIFQVPKPPAVKNQNLNSPLINEFDTRAAANKRAENFDIARADSNRMQISTLPVASGRDHVEIQDPCLLLLCVQDLDLLSALFIVTSIISAILVPTL